MSSRNTTVVGLIVSVLIVGAIASIGYYQFEVAPNLITTSTTTTQATCTPATCVNVSIIQGAIAPTSLGYAADTVTVIIGKNATVIWTNNDAVHHTVTSKSGDPASFGSPDMGPGDVYKFTFTASGTYTYGCNYHPNMRGTVIVKSS